MAQIGKLKLTIVFVCLLLPKAWAIEGVSVKTLKTNQKFIIAEDHSLPVVDIYTILRQGSIWDEPKYEGVTALMGEMLVRGTKSRTREQITDQLDQMGADISVNVSGESISISGHTLKRNLDKFFEIYADVILNPTFDQKELDKLKRETISDLKDMRENDQELVGRFFKRALYGKHPYGMTADGMESTVNRITRKKVVEYYQEFLSQENLLFAASGDLKTKYVTQKINDYFSGIKRGKALTFTYPKRKPLKGKTVVLVNKPARTQTQIMIGHFGIDVKNPDFFPLLVANNAFGGGFTARLMREVRVKRGWSYGAYSWWRPRKTPGEFGMFVFPAAKDTMNTLKLMLTLYEDYLEKGLTKEEFDRSKSNLINEYAFKFDSAKKKVSQIINIELAGLPKNYLETYRANLKKVTLKKANETIRKYGDANNLMITMVCTASQFKNKIKSIVGKDTKIIVKNYKDD